LNGKKIYNIRDLRENFDTAVLSGYFLGGSLMKWLSDIGEYSLLKRLSSIDYNGDIGTQLEFAFGVSPDKKHPADNGIKPLYPPSEIPLKAADIGMPEVLMFSGSFYGTTSSFSPFTESSFSVYSESVSSFGLTSSYAAFVSGQAVNMIQSSGSSFRKIFGILESYGSFGYNLSGSFLLSRWLTGSYKGFYAGSFLLSLLGGSFGLSSWNSGSGMGLETFYSEGSFRYTVGGITITAEEYHRTLINLSSCPLNAYGYGINLV